MLFPQRTGTGRRTEVDALMKLLRNYMKTCLKTAEKNRMCVRVLGDKTRLDQDIQTRIAELEEATKNNDGLHFQIAINYGGRDEIIRAVKKLSAKVQSGDVHRKPSRRICWKIIWIPLGYRIRIC